MKISEKYKRLKPSRSATARITAILLAMVCVAAFTFAAVRLAASPVNGAANGTRVPLILVDAGHGGTDPGALGPLRTSSASISEKDMNLSVALAAAAELESLGANVIRTRSGDVTVDLMDRVRALIGQEPDLFISLHQNSLGYSSDIRRVRGTVGLWWADAGALPAETISRALAEALGFKHRDTAQQMLAVCRNPKFPSCLIEVSFVTAVEEYEYMLHGGAETAGRAVARGVLDYYSEQQKWLKK